MPRALRLGRNQAGCGLSPEVASGAPWRRIAGLQKGSAHSSPPAWPGRPTCRATTRVCSLWASCSASAAKPSSRPSATCTKGSCGCRACSHRLCHLHPIRAPAGLRRAPRGALQAIAQYGNAIRGSLVHRRGPEHEFRDQRRATHQRYDRKRHPITVFRPRRRRRDLAGAAPGGDRVTHLIGASQSHRDRGGQHIDDVSSPLTETAPSGRGHGTPRKMLAASIIGSSSTH